MTPSPRAISAILGFLLAAGLAASRDARSDGPAAGPPTAEPDDIERALLAIKAPFLAERDAGVAALIRELPASRTHAALAFRTATGLERIALVEVLAADGSSASIDVLLSALVATDDPALSSAIRSGLVLHAEAVSKAVESYRDAKGQVPKRVDDVVDLLRRARIEVLFLGKKSRSGSTGYYRGQYDSLKPEREYALRVLVGILEDRAFKNPTEFPAGSYRFLRPPNFLVEPLEIRGNAANAIAELITPDDTWLIDQLGRDYRLLRNEAFRKQRENSRKARQIVLFMSPEDALLDIVLTTLAKNSVGGATDWVEVTDQRIEELKGRSLEDEAASMELRLGRYDEAIQLYEEEIRRRRFLAIPYYNVACAYATWSREFDLTEPRQAADLRRSGMLNLRLSVANGYEDWPWLEQDRDLDALRGESDYGPLLAGIKANFILPDAPKPGAPGGILPVRRPGDEGPVAPPFPEPPDPAHPAMGR